MSEKSIKEVLESMDPERAIHIQNIAYMIREEAMHDARALSKKYFIHGMIAGIVITSMLAFIIKLYYGG